MTVCNIVLCNMKFVHIGVRQLDVCVCVCDIVPACPRYVRPISYKLLLEANIKHNKKTSHFVSQWSPSDTPQFYLFS